VPHDAAFENSRYAAPGSSKSKITGLLHTPLTQGRDVARATGPAR
jgi:hypothetical protein